MPVSWPEKRRSYGVAKTSAFSAELAGKPPEVLAGLATTLSTAANGADAWHRLVLIFAGQDADGYSRWVATGQLPVAWPTERQARRLCHDADQASGCCRRTRRAIRILGGSTRAPTSVESSSGNEPVTGPNP